MRTKPAKIDAVARAPAVAGAALCVLAFAAIAWFKFCQFTSQSLLLRDYGIYANTLWNSAHGRWFTYLVDQNYLDTHLSFSLLMLAPLYHLWDDPFLLVAVQVACLGIGGLLLWLICRRSGFPASLSAALAFTLLAYPFTQCVLAHDFHGVDFYYVLLPCLYFMLAFRKRWAWLPLLLIAALREDGAFVALPMVLYVAVADRWRAGRFLAGGCLLYGVLAAAVLFPLINHHSLLDRRAGVLDATQSLASLGAHRSAFARVRAVALLFLPAALLLRRGFWLPIVAFPSLPLLLLLCSPVGHQQALSEHYSAGVFTCLVLGMVEAARRGNLSASKPTFARVAIPAYLVILALVSHETWGKLPKLHEPARISATMRPDPAYGRLREALRHIPRDGVLLTPDHLAGYCANRRDLMARKWYHQHPSHRIDCMFSSLQNAASSRSQERVWLRDGTFGATYFDGTFFVMARGADARRNAEVLRAIDEYRSSLAE